MNLTLSVDEATVDRAREVARQQGTSLNALIRTYLEDLAGRPSGEELVRQNEEFWAEFDAEAGSRATGPYKWNRDDAYDERMNRYKPK
jgi:hypothetical protein